MNALVNTRVGHPAHEDDRVQSDFPNENQEGPVGLEDHPVVVERAAGDADGRAGCCFAAFLVHLWARREADGRVSLCAVMARRCTVPRHSDSSNAVCHPVESTLGSGPSGALLVLGHPSSEY